MEALRKEDGDPRERKAGPGLGVPTPQRWGSRMAPLHAASPEGALGLTYSIRAGPVGAARLCCCSWGGFLAVAPPWPTPGSARDAPGRALHPEEPHGDPKEVQLPARPRCPDAAAWRALCGLDVGEVKKMFLITASSCLAFLHHSQLIKHFLLLSTHPHPASLPPAHRAPAPSWLLSLVPLLLPLSLTSCFPKFS